MPFALQDASPGESAERIYVFANGATGLDNPQRQGLDSALSDGRGPLNVLGGIPTINLDYSPMWRLFPAKWTSAAIKAGYRSRMSDAIHIEDMAAKGFITALDDGPLRPVGFIVNCQSSIASIDLCPARFGSKPAPAVETPRADGPDAGWERHPLLHPARRAMPPNADVSRSGKEPPRVQAIR